MDTGLTPRPFHMLAKPTGAACNLDCSYCFFLSKARLYPGSRLRMDDMGLEAYIRQLMEAHPGPEVAVAWQGGEPTLMGLPFFRRSVELVAKHRRPGVDIQYTIQTNGTRLDDEWARFFKDNDFLVGLSVDGPQRLHDQHRRARGGGGSFEQVMAGWEVLQRHAVDTNILCTVHRDNGDHPREVYRFFRDALGARHLQFIPVVERENAETAGQSAVGWGELRHLYVQAGDRAAPHSVGPFRYGAFMTAVWDEWVRRDVGEVFVQAFDVALGNRLGRHALCVHAPTCGDALVLEHNGDVYSCDHYVEPDYRLGNIHDTPLVDLVASPRQRRFGQDKQDTLPAQCRACDVLAQCHGGCPKDRFATTPGGEPGLNYLCEGYRAFFRHIAPAVEFMAGELLAGRPPAAVMGEMTRRDRALQDAVARTGRNEACPCGSGRKVKHCHGAG